MVKTWLFIVIKGLPIYNNAMPKTMVHFGIKSIFLCINNTNIHYSKTYAVVIV